MDAALLQEEVIPQLWSAYKKTTEYKSGSKKAIPAHASLVINAEIQGLRSIYIHFVKKLLEHKSLKGVLKKRTEAEWLAEWKQMHKKMFEHILKDCGNLRKKDVRFGEPGDEDLYKIPVHTNVPNELNSLSNNVVYFINHDHHTDEAKFITLAKIHYQFIRIHPFSDGNGRIARAITDQLAIFFGFPIAMGGYPRHDNKRREAYHKAIKSCINDPDCTLLAQWIRNYIDIQLSEIA